MRLLLKRFGVLVVAVGVALTGSSAFGDVQHSTWSSTYQDYSGQVPPTNARLQFQGPSGSYYPSGGGVGYVYQVTYSPAIDGTHIDGLWSYAGSNGWFSFRVSLDGSNFRGYWGFGQRGGPVSGSWNGYRFGGGPVPPPVSFP
jgi:hypothetical protein